MRRDWTQIPVGTPLGDFLRYPLALIPKRAVVKVLAGINQGMKWTVGSTNHSCWLGGYELDMQGAVRRLIGPGMTVFDIGANAGFYTLAFSRLVGNRGQVWAFEPFAENAHNLVRHVGLNGLANVTVVQAAVADRGGLAGLRVGVDRSTGALSDDAPYKVPTVSLDGLVEAGIAPAPDAIKIDVEGAEVLVLEGARSLVAAKRPVLFVALHGAEEKRRCREILASYGYEVFLLDGTPLGGAPLHDDEQFYAVSE
jgi:FkbM family methyltransferase